MLASGQSRLLMNLDDLRSYNPETATNFMRQPADYLPAYEEAMREIITSIDPSLAKQGATSKYRIGITGSFGEAHKAKGRGRSGERGREAANAAAARRLHRRPSACSPAAGRALRESVAGGRVDGKHCGSGMLGWGGPALTLIPPWRSAFASLLHAQSPGLP
jgi:DNA replicative helicase MCM subunit Mcm2 (Cdc46/Mcm family)